MEQYDVHSTDPDDKVLHPHLTLFKFSWKKSTQGKETFLNQFFCHTTTIRTITTTTVLTTTQAIIKKSPQKQQRSLDILSF